MERCQSLIHFHKSHQHLLDNSDTAKQYHNRKIPLHHLKTEWVRDLIRKLEYRAVSEIYANTREVVYPEQSEIMRWPVGSFQDFHIDQYDDENGQDTISDTTWAGVFYLNQDFRGGKLSFKPCEEIPLGFEYQPVAGELVLFKGMDFSHSVTKVYRNDRYTIPMWFTRTLEDIRPEVYTEKKI